MMRPAQMSDAHFGFEVDASGWEVATETETKTPGVFYHGSPVSDLGIVETGTFFTEVATYAAGYCTKLGRGGRIYRAEVVTRNPFIMPAEHSGFYDDEARFLSEVRARGHDCIVNAMHGVLWELIVFDEAEIKYRGTIGEAALIAREALASGIFYFVDGLPAPDYASSCSPVFSSHERADLASGAGTVRAVRVGARHPVYCERAAWPCMNFYALRTLHVDCLIDPEDGDALVVDRSLVVPLNRALRRKYRVQRR